MPLGVRPPIARGRRLLRLAPGVARTRGGHPTGDAASGTRHTVPQRGRGRPARGGARPARLAAGDAWRFEVKWDGFCAVVSTVDAIRVRSRRGWNMTALVPELGALPAGLVLDGELVALTNGARDFPRLCPGCSRESATWR